MAQTILTLNAGSSSFKLAVFDSGSLHCLARGEIEDLTTAPRLCLRDDQGGVVYERGWANGRQLAALLDDLLEFADRWPIGSTLAGVGHRVVHGGLDFCDPVRVTPDVLAALQALIPFDPLHLPLNLAPIEALVAARPDLPQILCFDTAFHHTMPAVATRLALPAAVTAKGIRRYGFHGLSYEFICGQLTAQGQSGGRVVIAHLGSGASLCAVQDGRSIATTMGFTPLDGLVMATRCGTLDPGVILYLGRHGYDFAAIEAMLYRQSGLLGVSGISGDMRVLLASGDARAEEAIGLFVYRIVWELGALASVMGGLDGLVFTGGIGAHAAAIRARIAGGLRWLGVELDQTANARNDLIVSAGASRIWIKVIQTDEESMIAKHASGQGLGPQV